MDGWMDGEGREEVEERELRDCLEQEDGRYLRMNEHICLLHSTFPGCTVVIVIGLRCCYCE